MVLAFEVRGFTPSSRGAMNKAVSELRSAHAVPSDIRERKAVYERKYPDAACTPSALAKHWPYLGGTVGDDSERQRNADLFARLNGGSS